MSDMPTDETYNGWKNRETWALNLWLSNDEGLYSMTNERVAQARDEYEPYEWTTPISDEDRAEHARDGLNRAAGDAVRDLWDELTDPDEQLMSCEAILQMVRDVGSEWRVDWGEIGAAWLSGLDES